MAEPVSLTDVIKRGGYEASLITTFNATFTFYEDFVLRRLIAAGSRYNVVMMDAVQCAQAWTSDAARPRLAGHAYALLPIQGHGAFHPKVCLLAGPRKATLLVGSHNLTLSGFGYNREVSNWIEISGAKDADGVAAVIDAWTMVELWINEQIGRLPAPLLESARALTKFIAPLAQRKVATGGSGLLGQSYSGPSLFEQLRARVPSPVQRILVIGAFFDTKFDLLRRLTDEWPTAEVVVVIDPDSVQMGTDLSGLKCRFVDSRSIWADDAHRYLHAKLIYFESARDGLLASGSANPSAPAWLGNAACANVEAVVLRRGTAARDVVAVMGLNKAFNLPSLSQDELQCAADRSNKEREQCGNPSEPVYVAVADAEEDLIHLDYPFPDRLSLIHAEGANADERWNGWISVAGPSRVSIRTEVPLARVRSLLLVVGDGRVLRAIVHHPNNLNHLAYTNRQAALREALGALGSGEGDVARLIASVEKVIFAEDIQSDLTVLSSTGRERSGDAASPERPKSLGVHVADMPTQKKKLRLLKSGDLAYLLDVLIRRLGADLERHTINATPRTRNEEEDVGQDEDSLPDALDDAEIAKIVGMKSRTLIRRMSRHLAAACEDGRKAQGAVVQLVAVLGLIRELRRLRIHPRWRKTPSLVAEVDRRDLLDAAMSALYGRRSSLLQSLLDQADGPIEEVGFLRALLLWLAWDLGEELTDRIGSLVEGEEALRAVRANAVLYELLPAAASDGDEMAELERSVRMTVVPTAGEGARAASWIRRHLAAGLAVKRISPEVFKIRRGLTRGSLAMVPKSEPARLRVVSSIDGPEVTLWDFDGPRTFVCR